MAKPQQIRNIKIQNMDKIKFKGQYTKLKFNLTALSKIEERGYNVTEEPDNLTVDMIRTYMWAGLLWKYPSLDIDEAGLDFDISDVGQIGIAIQTAFNSPVK